MSHFTYPQPQRVNMNDPDSEFDFPILSHSFTKTLFSVPILIEYTPSLNKFTPSE